MNGAVILDYLNAFGVLEHLQKRPPANWLCYGPKPVKQAAGVVVWLRPRGYYHYQTLTLFGVWTAVQDESIVVMAGTHTLTYAQPFYNAEAYFHAIRQDYERHYGRVTTPPAQPVWQAVYEASQRLTLRRELEAAVLAWREAQTAPEG
ncbi:MAG: hypothetical protein OHK0046_14660 [Anaerolineae bacterium]